MNKFNSALKEAGDINERAYTLFNEIKYNGKNIWMVNLDKKEVNFMCEEQIREDIDTTGSLVDALSSLLDEIEDFVRKYPKAFLLSNNIDAIIKLKRIYPSLECKIRDANKKIVFLTDILTKREQSRIAYYAYLKELSDNQQPDLKCVLKMPNNEEVTYA